MMTSHFGWSFFQGEIKWHYSKLPRMKKVLSPFIIESLRHLEKQDLANKNKYEQIVAKLDELISNPTEDNEQERIDLSNELNSLMPIMEVEQKHLTETGYQLPLDENFSISDAYNWLKGNIFTDSIDV